MMNKTHKLWFVSTVDYCARCSFESDVLRPSGCCHYPMDTTRLILWNNCAEPTACMHHLSIINNDFIFSPSNINKYKQTLTGNQVIKLTLPLPALFYTIRIKSFFWSPGANSSLGKLLSVQSQPTDNSRAETEQLYQWHTHRAGANPEVLLLGVFDAFINTFILQYLQGATESSRSIWVCSFDGIKTRKSWCLGGKNLTMLFFVSYV